MTEPVVPAAAETPTADRESELRALADDLATAADNLEDATSSLHHDEMPCTVVCHAASEAFDAMHSAAKAVPWLLDRLAELRAENETLLADNAQLQHDLGVAQADRIDQSHLLQRQADLIAEFRKRDETQDRIRERLTAERDRLQRQVDAVRALHYRRSTAALDAVQPETEER